MKPPVPFQWRGVHHGYIGAWFVAFGAFFLYMNWNNNLDVLNYLWDAFIGIGGYCIIDDTVEHLITSQTPLRILYNKLFGFTDP